MPDYRRNRVLGGTFFFTTNLQDRRLDFLTRHIDTLREAVRLTRIRHPFHIDAWVVLPDHMHCIWTLPGDDSAFPARWQMIKAAFSQRLPFVGMPTSQQAARGYRGIWQRGYWEHTIRDERDYAAHMDYVHFNPVKHGYVSKPEDWSHSSFRRCVAMGLYQADWDGVGSGMELSRTGERSLG